MILFLPHIVVSTIYWFVYFFMLTFCNSRL